VQEKLAFLQGKADAKTVDVIGEFIKEAPQNLDLLRAVRDGQVEADVKTRVSIAQDMLDRAGYGRVQKIIKSTVAMDAAAIERVKEMAAKARERRQAAEAVAVDVDVSEDKSVEETALAKTAEALV
jgi:hypothetical protein